MGYYHNRKGHTRELLIPVTLLAISVGLMLPGISSCISSRREAELINEAKIYAISRFGDNHQPLTDVQMNNWYHHMGIWIDGETPIKKDYERFIRESKRLEDGLKK
jgi:hypothetical protein